MALVALADCVGVTTQDVPLPDKTVVPGVIPGPEITVPLTMVADAARVSVAVLVEGIGAMVHAPEEIASVVATELTHLYTLVWPRIGFVTLTPMG